MRDSGNFFNGGSIHLNWQLWRLLCDPVAEFGNATGVIGVVVGHPYLIRYQAMTPTIINHGRRIAGIDNRNTLPLLRHDNPDVVIVERRQAGNRKGTVVNGVKAAAVGLGWMRHDVPVNRRIKQSKIQL